MKCRSDCRRCDGCVHFRNIKVSAYAKAYPYCVFGGKYAPLKFGSRCSNGMFEERKENIETQRLTSNDLYGALVVDSEGKMWRPYTRGELDEFARAQYMFIEYIKRDFISKNKYGPKECMMHADTLMMAMMLIADTLSTSIYWMCDDMMDSGRDDIKREAKNIDRIRERSIEGLISKNASRHSKWWRDLSELFNDKTSRLISDYKKVVLNKFRASGDTHCELSALIETIMMMTGVLMTIEQSCDIYCRLGIGMSKNKKLRNMLNETRPVVDLVGVVNLMESLYRIEEMIGFPPIIKGDDIEDIKYRTEAKYTDERLLRDCIFAVNDKYKSEEPPMWWPYSKD